MRYTLNTDDEKEGQRGKMGPWAIWNNSKIYGYISVFILFICSCLKRSPKLPHQLWLSYTCTNELKAYYFKVHGLVIIMIVSYWTIFLTLHVGSSFNMYIAWKLFIFAQILYYTGDFSLINIFTLLVHRYIYLQWLFTNN